MVEAVILDVDGTLVDSVDLHAEAWQEALSHFGYQVPFARVREQIGKGADQLIPVFVPERELRHVYRSLDQHRSELFQRLYLPKVRAFPGALELVERLKADGKRIVLASSAKGEELAHYQRIVGLDGELVDHQTSQDAVDKSKPHPDIFEDALAQLEGVPPNHCVAVGDTPYDALAARKAHVRCVGVLSGGFPEDSLWRAGCVRVYRDVAELLECYRASPDTVFEGGVASFPETAPVA